MATISKRVCDRCGREMAYSGWTAKIKGMKRIGCKFILQSLLNGNPTGYLYSDYNYELCSECTKKLEYFLRNENESQ